MAKDAVYRRKTSYHTDEGHSSKPTPADKPTANVNEFSTGNNVTVKHNPGEFLSTSELQRKNANKKSKRSIPTPR